MTHCYFFRLWCRSVVASFDQKHGSSDGGASLLKAADRPLGRAELYRMGVALAESVIERHRMRPGAQGSADHSIWTRPTIRSMVPSSCPLLEADSEGPA